MAKGVATLMDTVFLLLIAGVAAAILFSAAANYGRNLETQANQLLVDYYTRQVVRVLSTATINRPGCSTPDYLLAYLKEKIYYGTLADQKTLENLQEVLLKAMEPLGDAYDYALVIRTGSASDSDAYIFLWQHTRSGLEGHCYVATVGAFKQWLTGFRERFIGVYSYTVPIRLKLRDNTYTKGYITIMVWPSGASIPDPPGEKRC